MDEGGVTRATPRLTLGIVVGAHVCDQVAALFGIGEKAVCRAFLGGPVEDVLAMAEWALSHENEAGFEPEMILTAWARKRGRGACRAEDPRVEGCGHCHGSAWAPAPFKTAEEWGEERQGVECPACRGVALKPLKLDFNGREGR